MHERRNWYLRRNFCTFWADTRKVTNKNGSIEVISDNQQKIFQVNDRVLFGAGGWFHQNENLQDAYSSIENIDNASVKIVKNAVVSYMNNMAFPNLYPMNRCYLVGGKTNNGVFVIYEIRWDSIKNKVVVTERLPTPPSSNFGISFMLPNATPEFAGDYMNRVASCIKSSVTHKNLSENICNLIDDIASIDQTVGHGKAVLSIT